MTWHGDSIICFATAATYLLLSLFKIHLSYLKYINYNSYYFYSQLPPVAEKAVYDNVQSGKDSQARGKSLYLLLDKVIILEYLNFQQSFCFVNKAICLSEN